MYDDAEWSIQNKISIYQAAAIHEMGHNIAYPDVGHIAGDTDYYNPYPCNVQPPANLQPKDKTVMRYSCLANPNYLDVHYFSITEIGILRDHLNEHGHY